jgi:hypothetical protein
MDRLGSLKRKRKYPTAQSSPATRVIKEPSTKPSRKKTKINPNDDNEQQEQQQKELTAGRKVFDKMRKTLEMNNRAKHNMTREMKKEMQQQQQQQQDISFNILGTYSTINNLRELQDTLVKSCLDIYELCDSRNNPTLPQLQTVTVQAQSTSPVKNPSLHTIATATGYLKQALTILLGLDDSSLFGDTKEPESIVEHIKLHPKNEVILKKMEKQCGNMLKYLNQINSNHNKATKICRESIACIQNIDDAFKEWELWKVMYVSQLRIQYDPTLCGGISKPTLDTLCAQSNASKLRLDVQQGLLEERVLIMKRLDELKSVTRPVTTSATTKRRGSITDKVKQLKLTNKALELTDIVLELSRDELESNYLDTKNKLLRYDSSTVTTTPSVLGHNQSVANTREEWKKRDLTSLERTALIKLQHQKKTRAHHERLFPHLHITPEEKDQDYDPSMYGMPDLTPSTRLTNNEPPVPMVDDVIIEKHTPAQVQSISTTTTTKKVTSINDKLDAQFGQNSVKTAAIAWNSGLYNMPLSAVNWASKTTVRASPNGNMSNIIHNNSSSYNKNLTNNNNPNL